MLDYKTAGALAMSYDGMLGIEVLTILEDSLSTIRAMTIEAAKITPLASSRPLLASVSGTVSAWSSVRVPPRMRTAASPLSVLDVRVCNHEDPAARPTAHLQR